MNSGESRKSCTDSGLDLHFLDISIDQLSQKGISGAEKSFSVKSVNP